MATIHTFTAFLINRATCIQIDQQNNELILQQVVAMQVICLPFFVGTKPHGGDQKMQECHLFFRGGLLTMTMMRKAATGG